jgi:hypothetical protein
MNITMTLIATSFILLAAAVQATNLRALTVPHECTINAIALLQIPGEAPLANEVEYGCDDGSGLFSPLHLDEIQQKSLQGLAANGQVHYGKSKINVHGATITTPSGKPISAEAKNKENAFNKFISAELDNIENALRRRTNSKASKRHFLLFR